MSACWSEHGQEIRDLLISFDSFKNSLGNPLKLAALIDEVDLYLGGDVHAPPPQSLFQFFTPEGLQTYTRVRQTPPQHPFFELCATAAAARTPLDDGYHNRLLDLKSRFTRTLHRELSERKKARNVRHFDDLLLDVRNRLAGPGGPRLCQAIRSQFGAAFIDEFQDTDPVQFEIFQKLYPDKMRPVFFIGDPKQAIYSFRGADIFAYIAATHTVESICTLGTNWRSSPALVKAVNTLFAAHDNPFVFAEIGFQPVAHKAQDPLDVLIVDDNDNDPPLHFWSCEPLGEGKKEDNLDISRHRMATAVAAEIVRLLNLAAVDRATVAGRRLKAGDMAVLVYTHTQASLIQNVLKEHGIPGVQSGTGSLFEAPEAREVLRVLQALADPVDESRLKAALATDLFGCNGIEIGQLVEDESLLELFLDKFMNYNKIWRERGLIAMTGELLSKERVRQRLLGLSDGPRRLTNLLHCFEILHKATTEHHFGCDGLIKWFTKQFEETRENEEYQIRLETDDNAVQIVTIHKSKGLEYPIVFSPFNWNQPTGGNSVALFHHPDHELKRAIDLGSPDLTTHQKLADRERHAEQMRLLYVALTRARYRCYVGWGVLKGGDKSALGYLLHAPRQTCPAPGYEMPDKIDIEQIQATFATLSSESSGTILLSALPEEVPSKLVPCRREDTKLIERSFSGEIDRSWAISSFTSLTTAHSHHQTTDSDEILVIRDETDLAETGSNNEFEAFIDFPRGALAGSCLHQLFEELDFHQKRAVTIEDTVTEALTSFAFDLNWTDAVTKMVHKTLSTPLTSPEGNRFCLEEIPAEQKLAEMEFHLPLASIAPQGLAHVFSQHAVGPRLADFADRLASLGFARHHGMLHGFIDLIFCHQERYYLVDWKSNNLGSHPEDYTPEALATAMMTNDYILQYHLYLAALHRYLENLPPWLQLHPAFRRSLLHLPARHGSQRRSYNLRHLLRSTATGVGDRFVQLPGDRGGGSLMRDNATVSHLGEGFARMLERLQGETIPELSLAARLLCAAINRGHVCLNLASALTEESDLCQTGQQNSTVTNLSLPDWRSRLLDSRVVGQPGELRPLILDQANRLYLYRYWAYEQALAEGVARRARDISANKIQGLATIVERYFPDRDEAVPDWQRIATLIAVTRAFTVISGGPGTGKTTTVVKILALLLELSEQAPLSIALAAPTGKAAARLKSSISKAKGRLPCSDDLRDQIPEEVQTLHRLLGFRHRSPYFRHDADTPLPYDVVVVDEASMVDLPLMAKLVSALHPQARLILLGDKNQLASVEAGAVLGDICQTGTDTLFSKTMHQHFGPLLELPDSFYGSSVASGLTDSLVTLQRNYRFAADSGISRLARAVNEGASQQAEQLLDATDTSGTSWRDCPESSRLAHALKEPVLEGFSPYLSAASVEEAFNMFSRFMILCALRNGPFGVVDVSQTAESILAQSGIIHTESRWYHGKPIMVTANDYRLGLFNGDTGIVWPDPDREGQLRAFFPDASGTLRSLAPARLPAHETVFACTVHKSQGSEFERVLLLLPPHDSRALTRELVYTGITRAKGSVQLWGSRETLRLALGRRVQRNSGLRTAIWGDDQSRPSA